MGEAEFGLIDGVLSTTAGWIGEVEVAEVEFDPRTVAFESLLEHAIARDCAIRVFARDDHHFELALQEVGDRAVRTDEPIRIVEDQQYYLGRTELRYVPMTRAQAARVNADVRDAERWLSPRQIALLRDAKRNPDPNRPVVMGLPVEEGWALVSGD